MRWLCIVMVAVGAVGVVANLVVVPGLRGLIIWGVIFLVGLFGLVAKRSR